MPRVAIYGPPPLLMCRGGIPPPRKTRVIGGRNQQDAETRHPSASTEHRDSTVCSTTAELTGAPVNPHLTAAMPAQALGCPEDGRRPSLGSHECGCPSLLGTAVTYGTSLSIGAWQHVQARVLSSLPAVTCH
jgi:hypothetical protein